MSSHSTPPDYSKLTYRTCVGVMLLNTDNKVFVGKRTDKKREHTAKNFEWQMPQGGVDKGEDLLAAAKRELYEETNIQSVELLAEAKDWLTYDIPAEILGNHWKSKYRGQTQKWFAFRFTGNENEINVLNPGFGQHKPEFSDWKWVEHQALADMVIPFKRPVYVAAISEFADLFKR